MIETARIGARKARALSRNARPKILDSAATEIEQRNDPNHQTQTAPTASAGSGTGAPAHAGSTPAPSTGGPPSPETGAAPPATPTNPGCARPSRAGTPTSRSRPSPPRARPPPAPCQPPQPGHPDPRVHHQHDFPCPLSHQERSECLAGCAGFTVPDTALGTIEPVRVSGWLLLLRELPHGSRFPAVDNPGLTPTVDSLESPSSARTTSPGLARPGTSRSGAFFGSRCSGSRCSLHVAFVERAAWVQEHAHVVVCVVFATRR